MPRAGHYNLCNNDGLVTCEAMLCGQHPSHKFAKLLLLAQGKVSSSWGQLSSEQQAEARSEAKGAGSGELGKMSRAAFRSE